MTTRAVGEQRGEADQGHERIGGREQRGEGSDQWVGSREGRQTRATILLATMAAAMTTVIGADESGPGRAHSVAANGTVRLEVADPARLGPAAGSGVGATLGPGVLSTWLVNAVTTCLSPRHGMSHKQARHVTQTGTPCATIRVRRVLQYGHAMCDKRARHATYGHTVCYNMGTACATNGHAVCHDTGTPCATYARVHAHGRIHVSMEESRGSGARARAHTLRRIDRGIEGGYRVVTQGVCCGDPEVHAGPGVVSGVKGFGCGI